MAIARLGTFPVSSLNIGLAATLPGLQAEVAKLGFDISKLEPNLQGAVDVGFDFPPNVPLYAQAAATGLTVQDLGASVFGAPTAAVDVDVDLAAELGFVNAQLKAVLAVRGKIAAGLAAGGLAAYTYAGRAAGFGTTLAGRTQAGIGAIAPTDPVQALIIATPSFSSWGSFSFGFETGDTADQDLGTTTTEERLKFLGSLGGRQLNTGAAAIDERLRLFELLLRGLKATLEANLGLVATVPSLDLQGIVNAGLDVDFDLAIENFVNVRVDVGAEIGSVQARLDLLLKLIGDIEASLSAGGLVLWSYKGPAALLGIEFAPEVAGGLPGSPGADRAAYGAVVATALPSAWVDFATIFKT